LKKFGKIIFIVPKCRPFVKFADVFLRKDLDKRDEPKTVGKIGAQIVEPHVGDFEMLVAPSREGVFLNLLPGRVVGQVAFRRWNFVTVPLL
jgi:hypothetical protein